MIECLDKPQLDSQLLYVKFDGEFAASTNQTAATYEIKFCSNSNQTISDLAINQSQFCDSKNSLMKHYDEQIQRLLHLDKQNQELKDILEQQNTIINHLKVRLGL
ncbi:hypothetical protein MNBD_GAMMA01-2073 [hydrothermal vent metagenome]|uniref:Uncharacterized protein n=1 Tax=hydrothermal vent metagenome TaxID=652676 RepID=A0A3B0VXE9_9ZZZZ